MGNRCKTLQSQSDMEKIIPFIDTPFVKILTGVRRYGKSTTLEMVQTFSAATLSKYLKSQNRQMDPETVYSYLNKLENAYILHRCSRYDIKGKEILKIQEKFYLADSSFRFAVLGYDENAAASILENLVYLELVRRGYDVYVGKLDHTEIDFVATRKKKSIFRFRKGSKQNGENMAICFPLLIIIRSMFCEWMNYPVATMKESKQCMLQISF